MTGYSGFQPNAFQHNAFQIVVNKGVTDQGAGRGHRKRQAGEERLKFYRDIGEKIAKSKEAPAKKIKPDEKIIRFVPKKTKIGDLEQVKSELSKFKFDKISSFSIAEDKKLLLQSMEEDAIALLLLMS